MDEPSFMYSENLTTDHINYFQTHILDIRGSMNIFDRVQSPSPSKNSMMINIPANSIDLVPTLPLNFGPSPINCIFERLIDDTNRRSVLKEKIESFSIQRDMQTADKFKSPKRMRRDQVDELYNRLLLDQKQRQEALNMRQVMRESPTRETSNVRISKQQEKEMLNRLQDYALQKKVWIEAMQEKKKRLEEAEIQRLKSSSSKRSRDPNLFERLSIPKTPSPLRKKRESPARTERSHTVQVINKTREAKKST